MRVTRTHPHTLSGFKFLSVRQRLRPAFISLRRLNRLLLIIQDFAKGQRFFLRSNFGDQDFVVLADFPLAGSWTPNHSLRLPATELQRRATDHAD
jgi:hypothetical protein